MKRLKLGLFIPILAVFGASLCLAPGFFQALAGLAALILIAIQDFEALRTMGRLRVWFFPALFFLLAPFFAGHPDALVFGRGYSLVQLKQGMAFLLHAYVFTALMALVSRNVSAEDVTAKAEAWGLRRFGLRLALALVAVKLLRRMMVEAFGHYRRQRPGWTRFIGDLPVLAGAVMGNCGRVAENIAILFYIRGVRV